MNPQTNSFPGILAVGEMISYWYGEIVKNHPWGNACDFDKSHWPSWHDVQLMFAILKGFFRLVRISDCSSYTIVGQNLANQLR